MYRYILFDLDGTLTDSKEGIMNCFKYAIEKLGDPIPSEETLLSFIGPPLKHSFASLGYDEVAQVCLTHSFRNKSLADYIGRFDTTEEEMQLIDKSGSILNIQSLTVNTRTSITAMLTKT